MNPLKLLTKNRRFVIIRQPRKLDERDPKGYDLCLQVNDAYIDIIRNTRDKWRLMIVGETFAQEVDSRTECIDILEKLT